MKATLIIRKIPTVEITGRLVNVDRKYFEFMTPLYDLPDGEYLKVFQDVGFEDQNGNYDIIGFLHGDGSVDCVSLDTRINKWRWFGDYYGYPACCVEHFCNTTGTTTPSHFDGTGFVPCPTCEERSMNELVVEIHRQRKCPTPFMMDVSGEDEDYHLLQHLIDGVPSGRVDIHYGDQGALCSDPS